MLSWWPLCIPKKNSNNISSMIVVSTLMSFSYGSSYCILCFKIFFLMKAIFLNISAWIMLPFMDAIAKYLSSSSFFSNNMGKIFFYCIPSHFLYVFIFFIDNLGLDRKSNFTIYRGLTLFFANILFLFNINNINGQSILLWHL